MISKLQGIDRPRKILRRKPKQKRSKVRIENILNASADLIRERGIDAVTMKEIGARTGGPIASVYQYFPDKTAILTLLHERRADEARRILRGSLKGISTVEDVIRAQSQIIDRYYNRMRIDANAIDTLNAIKACKTLSVRDLTEMRARADEFFEATKHFVDPKNHGGYRYALFLSANMADSSVRLAVSQPEPQGDEIIHQFKAIACMQTTYYLTGKFLASLL